MSLNGTNCTCLKESVDLFAKHFASVYSSKSVNFNLQPLNIPFFDLPYSSYFTPYDVLYKLSNLKNVFSIGPDEIPGDFLYKKGVIFSFLSGPYFEDPLMKFLFRICEKSALLLPF